MSVLPIVTLGDPRLRLKGEPVDGFGKYLHGLLDDLAETMRAAPGVGLAAPQVGVSLRLLVYRLGDEAPLVAVANPEVEWASDDEEAMTEGCLSIPGIGVEVERPLAVTLTGQDLLGAPLRVEAEGRLARIFQHEIDHLDGVLILDRTDRESRKNAMREMRERLLAGR